MRSPPRRTRPPHKDLRPQGSGACRRRTVFAVPLAVVVQVGLAVVLLLANVLALRLLQVPNTLALLGGDHTVGSGVSLRTVHHRIFSVQALDLMRSELTGGRALRHALFHIGFA